MNEAIDACGQTKRTVMIDITDVPNSIWKMLR